MTTINATAQQTIDIQIEEIGIAYAEHLAYKEYECMTGDCGTCEDFGLSMDRADYNRNYAQYVRFVACVRPITEADLIDAHAVALGGSQPTLDAAPDMEYPWQTCAQCGKQTSWTTNENAVEPNTLICSACNKANADLSFDNGALEEACRVCSNSPEMHSTIWHDHAYQQGWRVRN